MKIIDKFLAGLLTVVACFVIPALATHAASWAMRVLFSGLFFWAVVRPVYFSIEKFFHHDDL